MTKSKPAKAAKSLTVEQKIEQLEQLVAWFESDEFRLSQAAKQYQQVEELAASIQADLTQLKNTITKIDDPQAA